MGGNYDTKIPNRDKRKTCDTYTKNMIIISTNFHLNLLHNALYYLQMCSQIRQIYDTYTDLHVI